jgi:hypothetical protein
VYVVSAKFAFGHFTEVDKILVVLYMCIMYVGTYRNSFVLNSTKVVSWAFSAIFSHKHLASLVKNHVDLKL